MNPQGKNNYKELAKVVRDMKIEGYKWLGRGWAEFRGQKIDLTATRADCLAVGYSTLSQLT